MKTTFDIVSFSLTVQLYMNDDTITTLHLRAIWEFMFQIQNANNQFFDSFSLSDISDQIKQRTRTSVEV